MINQTFELGKYNPNVKHETGWVGSHDDAMFMKKYVVILKDDKYYVGMSYFSNPMGIQTLSRGYPKFSDALRELKTISNETISRDVYRKKSKKSISVKRKRCKCITK